MYFLSHKKYNEICTKQYTLTTSESAIFFMVLKGFSNQEIMDNRSCAIKTIRSHLNNIYNKLRVCSKAQAVCFFYLNFVTLEVELIPTKKRDANFSEEITKEEFKVETLKTLPLNLPTGKDPLYFTNPFLKTGNFNDEF